MHEHGEGSGISIGMEELSSINNELINIRIATSAGEFGNDTMYPQLPTIVINEYLEANVLAVADMNITHANKIVKAIEPYIIFEKQRARSCVRPEQGVALALRDDFSGWSCSPTVAPSAAVALAPALAHVVLFQLPLLCQSAAAAASGVHLQRRRTRSRPIQG